MAVNKEYPREVQEWLDKLEINITDNPTGYHLQLQGHKRIVAFFEKEHSYWEPLAPENEQTVGRWITMLDTIIQELNTLPTVASNDINVADQKFAPIVQQVDTLLQNNPGANIWRYYYSKSAEGQFLYQFGSLNQEYLRGAILFFNNQLFNSVNQQNQIIGYNLAIEFKAAKLDLKKRSGAEKGALTRIRQEWETKTQELEQSFERHEAEWDEWQDQFQSDNTKWQKDHQTENKTWQETFHAENTTWNADRQTKFDETLKKSTDRSDTLYSEAKTEFDTIRKTFEEQIALKGPSNFWKIRAAKYKSRGQKWLVGLIITTVVVVSALSTFLYYPPEWLFPADVNQTEQQDSVVAINELKPTTNVADQHERDSFFTPKSIKGMFILATIISLFVYLIRILARMVFSSFHLERDAEERRQLTMVYLALIRNDAVFPKEDREIILNSLFSRAEIGILGDDHGPTMPHTAVFEAAVRKK